MVPTVLVERPAEAEAVALVTLNRPEHGNGVVPELARELMAAFTGLEEDLDVRAVVLTGAGRDFSAGADLFALHDYLAKELAMIPREGLHQGVVARWSRSLHKDFFQKSGRRKVQPSRCSLLALTTSRALRCPYRRARAEQAQGRRRSRPARATAHWSCGEQRMRSRLGWRVRR
jgi:hypothetical protein